MYKMQRSRVRPGAEGCNMHDANYLESKAWFDGLPCNFTNLLSKTQLGKYAVLIRITIISDDDLHSSHTSHSTHAQRCEVRGG